MGSYHLFGTSVASRASRRYFLSGRLEFRELGLLGSTSAERLPIDLQRNVSAACRAGRRCFLGDRLEFHELGSLGGTSAERLPIDPMEFLVPVTGAIGAASSGVVYVSMEWRGDPQDPRSSHPSVHAAWGVQWSPGPAAPPPSRPQSIDRPWRASWMWPVAAPPMRRESWIPGPAAEEGSRGEGARG